MRRDDDAEDEEKRMYREQARALEEGKNICEWEYKLICWAGSKLIVSSYSRNLFSKHHCSDSGGSDPAAATVRVAVDGRREAEAHGEGSAARRGECCLESAGTVHIGYQWLSCEKMAVLMNLT